MSSDRKNLRSDNMAERAARGSVDTFRAALAKVPDVEPEEFDRR